ncbi:MAG: hypothetical protein JSW63_05375 [Ignavibacterium sp.]|nr:MAG: hypothetical protein JSW63_05375 [Ignavibacterium sp.]
MGTDSKYYQEVIGKLERLCKKKYVLQFLLGFQAVMFIALMFLTVFSLFEMIAGLNSSSRTFLIYLVIVFVAGSTAYLLLIPLLRYLKFFRKESYHQVAKIVGENYPDVHDDLLNSMQLVSSEENKKYYSLPLINAAFKKVYNNTKNLKFESIINFNRTKKNLIYLAGALLVVIFMFSFLPGLQAATYRLMNYDQEFIEPADFTFAVSPGNREITKGEDVILSVTAKGEAPDEISIAIKKEDETVFNLQRVTPDSSSIYNLKLTSVRSSFKYYAFAQSISSDEFEIKVIDRPIVKTLELNISPPAYSKMDRIIQRDNGNVTALVGTRVNISLSSTKNLGRAYLEFTDSTFIDLDVTDNTGAGRIYVRKDNQYFIKLVDKVGNDNLSPISYQINALTDAYPSIKMIAPDMNIKLANDNRVDLSVEVKDDYGFSNLKLNYRLSSSRYEIPWDEYRQLEIPLKKTDKEIAVKYIWNLTQLSLGVDDAVSYYLEVFDNDNVNGPKSAKTKVLTVKVPSLDEILAEADQVQSDAEMKLEQTLKEAEDLKNTLEEIDQELKKDDEKLSWEEKEKIENALEKYEELQKNMEDVSEQLQRIQNELQQNNLISEETMQKYMELQELMDEMTSEELKKALEELRNTLQQLNRRMTQDQLQNMKLDEERFKKSIERTLNLLKRIQIEQKIDALIKRTEELTDEQSDLKEQTQQSEGADQNEKNKLSDKQTDISKMLDDLNSEMKNLDEKMSELDDMPQEELDKIMDEMNEQQNENLSEQASQDIQQNQMQKAMQQQQQIKKNMSQLNQRLQDLKDQMMMQNQMQTFTDMMKILDNMLELSKRQEDLKDETKKSEPNSSSFNEKAEVQENLKRNLSNLMSQMSELSQKTFAITPEMGRALGEAKKKMQQSIQAMQNRNGAFAGITQEEAMMHLNEAAMMMKGSMEVMMQGGGGSGGMMSLMQQLQQMSGQQMQLNNLTQMLKQMQQGQLTPQQQAEMQRLAQQQELIRKSLGQLNEEAKISGQSKKITADLESIMNEMYEVLTDMKTEKLDDELIQKQENILSKLLDAQRSINERDFEKERKSRSGENLVLESPSEINLDSEEGKDNLRDELNKAVQEGYVKDFEELIIKYYNAIQKEAAVEK